MVRKKKRKESEQPPWCYYCDRIFSDESTLIQHQKAKHFKCTTCHRKLTSASGLRVHCHQVHRFTLDKVPAAKLGRDSIELEVFGMSGVPEGATPEDPLIEGDEPANKAARTDVPTPQPLPQLAPVPPQPYSQILGPPPGLPPPLSLPIGQTMAVPPPLPAAAAYASQWTFPLPYPSAFPGVQPPWPRPAYLGGHVPQLPGIHHQLPEVAAGSISLAPQQPMGTGVVPPLFPIATNAGAPASRGTLENSAGLGARHHHSDEQIGTQFAQDPQDRAGGMHALHNAAPATPTADNGSLADDISAEERRAQHLFYRRKLAVHTAV
ncbi:g7855 [Coccomyxa elongata]